MSGWLKLHRQLLNWEWHSDPNTLSVFIHCLLMANHEASRWKGVDIQPGQFPAGRRSLSEATGLNERQVRTALEHLKTSGEVTSINKGRYSIFTVSNWAKYQQGDQQNVQQKSGNRPAESPTEVRQPTTLKEYKKIRSKEDRTPIPPWLDETIWSEFVRHRKVMKSEMSALAEKKLIAELDKLRMQGHSPTEVINQSIINGWKGVFKLKEKNNGTHTKYAYKNKTERLYDAARRAAEQGGYAFGIERGQAEAYGNADPVLPEPQGLR